MEIMQRTPEQPVRRGRNKYGDQSILRQIKNENIAYQNLWNTPKVVLSGNFIAINARIKKKEDLK